jgi:antiphage defense system Thoeris ThsB-like protein
MARRVFYSFHYKPDCSRAALVRNMGIVEGNKPASDNEWEEITEGGNEAIQNWIDGQLDGKSCNVVLIGENTAGRKWIKYEIKKAWNTNKGVVGVYIHRLKNLDREQSSKGRNPFDDFTVGKSAEDLSSVVKAYNPPYSSSKDVYAYISENLAGWIDEAIEIRDNYSG